MLNSYLNTKRHHVPLSKGFRGESLTALCWGRRIGLLSQSLNFMRFNSQGYIMALVFVPLDHSVMLMLSYDEWFSNIVKDTDPPNFRLCAHNTYGFKGVYLEEEDYIMARLKGVLE